MSGRVRLDVEGQVARVTLSHSAKFNAMSRAMWRELRSVFDMLSAREDLRCVIVAGEGGHFCAGGDIAEYPGFRFEEASLRAFHEGDVWGGLSAMLACDIPIVAQIEGHCMGAGVEIACCCDIRLAAESARFGAPIARLGFPMAPREAQLVLREAGAATAREMLLEAAVLEASEMKARGFLHAVLPGQMVAAQAHDRALRIAALAPRAARLNKQAMRALVGIEPPAGLLDHAYRYADGDEHREGVTAFLNKRRAVF
ncbi:MAG: enoyl-CoA hydratase/isomerase family protein [Hydrogenophaga sp.]|uniref:enoyl-CoA hydratase/isomerase family protein n=1 Tax=Hydrogenophaga sp. TaxID=1904254 RepID=UPI003D0CFECD